VRARPEYPTTWSSSTATATTEPTWPPPATRSTPTALSTWCVFSPDQAEQAVDVFGGEVEQFVFCSTVDVYHRPLDTNPVQEDAPREPPVSDYGADKAECEDLFMAAHDRGDFETTVIRPWCTYGEGGTVLHTLGQGSYFLDRIRQGKPVVIHGDGQTLGARVTATTSPARSSTPWATRRPTARPTTSPARRTSPGAVLRDRRRRDGRPDPELVHIPTEILAEAVPDRTGMLLDHFQFSTVFDNSKARRDLDFEYTITFEEGSGALSSGWRSAAKLRTGTARTTTNLSKPGARLQGSSSIRSRSDSIGDVRYPGPERDESHSRPEKVPRTDEHRAERVGVGVQKREVARREEAPARVRCRCRSLP